MKRREEKTKVREIWHKTFGDLDVEDEWARAGRVRSLCPCEYSWTVPLWDIIFAACEDPSPLVRAEALHVIEDAYEHGFATAGGMALLYAARHDPAPEVRRFANDVLKPRPKRPQPRNRIRDRILQKIARQDEREE